MIFFVEALFGESEGGREGERGGELVCGHSCSLPGWKFGAAPWIDRSR